MIYLGLGSNIGNRAKNIENALVQISERIGTILCVSSLYESEAWGYSSNNKFLNIAAVVETTIAPEEILQKIKEIESILGRSKKKTETYEDRLIDIDILFYDDLIIEKQQLGIPHQHIEKRKFVLAPMLEIAPDFVHPVLRKTIRELNDELLSTNKRNMV